MKYYFIINPIAGKKEEKNKVEEYIKEVCEKKSLIYEIYYSKSKGDAMQFTSIHKDEDCCIFACGGDGTVYEVVNGAIGGKCSIGIYPCGSGNDFVKIFKDAYDLEKVLSSSINEVDTININGKHSINIVNVGFDAAVNGSVDRYKKRFSVGTAYNLSIITNLLKRMNHKYTIKIDDEIVESGYFLLMSLGNGSYYGGGFKCAPRAVIDDGLIEFCAIRKLGRLKLAKIIKKYKAGLHLDDPKLEKIVLYKRCKKVEIYSDKEFAFTVDGENSKSYRIEAKIEEKSIKLIHGDLVKE